MLKGEQMMRILVDADACPVIGIVERIAKAHGIPVFLDAGPAMRVPLEKFRGITIISPNEAETYAITGIRVTDVSTARRASEYIFQNASPQYVLLKLGEHGAYLYDGKHGEVYPALRTKAALVMQVRRAREKCSGAS